MPKRGDVMGVLYTVIPLLPDHRDELEDWLRSLNMASPADAGRYPSLQELRSVLDHLEGYSIRYSTSRVLPGHWYADIVQADQRNGEWAFIVVNDYTGMETDAYKFGFERGAPRLMLLILQRVASLCGPLLVVPDTGALPIIVTPDLDLDQALHTWE
jgi:hypothetical protein